MSGTNNHADTCEAQELRIRRNGDGDKAALARRLRAETPLTWRWIAEGLSKGASGSTANGVSALERK